jgi:hypothetical protein
MQCPEILHPPFFLYETEARHHLPKRIPVQSPPNEDYLLVSFFVHPKKTIKFARYL